MVKRIGLFMVGALLVFVACNDGSDSVEEKEPNDTNPGNEGWLVRAATPESSFAPAGIEDAIDDIVSALNNGDQELGMKLAFIPKDATAFFDPAVLGANRAHAELGALGTVVAPNPDEDPDGPTALELQLGLFEDQVTAGVKGIGVAPQNSDLLEAIDTAVDSDITIVTFDGDVPDSKRHLYLGTINAEAGKTGGETLAGLLGDTTGTVVILGYDNEVWRGGYDRTHEARKALEAAGHTVVIRHTNWSDHQENVDFITETFQTADPPAVGCLGVFSNSFACAQAAEATEMTGDIAIAAFDAEPETLEYMQQGLIQATHTQRVYYMGYLLPYLLYAVNTIGLEETKSLVSELMVEEGVIDTGLDVIPADGVDAYNEFMDELGAL